MEKDKNGDANTRHSQFGMNRIDEAHELENRDRFSKYDATPDRQIQRGKSKRLHKK